MNVRYIELYNLITYNISYKTIYRDGDGECRYSKPPFLKVEKALHANNCSKI